MNSTPTPRRTAQRSAYSLVEVVAAIALMSATLVPAVAFVRDAMEVSVEADERQLLCLYAVSQVENRLAAIAADWSSGTSVGDYAAEGRSDIRYETVADDSAASGGIVGSLMDIRTTVYVDADADGSAGANELSCFFRTKLARLATYEALDE